MTPRDLVRSGVALTDFKSCDFSIYLNIMKRVENYEVQDYDFRVMINLPLSGDLTLEVTVRHEDEIVASALYRGDHRACWSTMNYYWVKNPDQHHGALLTLLLSGEMHEF